MNQDYDSGYGGQGNRDKRQPPGGPDRELKQYGVDRLIFLPTPVGLAVETERENPKVTCDNQPAKNIHRRAELSFEKLRKYVYPYMGISHCAGEYPDEYACNHIIIGYNLHGSGQVLLEDEPQEHL
nr:hypothetical protein [Stutzerimonas stutzeri]